MVSIVERRKQIEEEVRQSGKLFLNDMYINYGPKPFWDFGCTGYRKEWGKQGALYISGDFTFPKEQKAVKEFSLSLWNKDTLLEKYNFAIASGSLLDNNFYANAYCTPDSVNGFDTRPLNLEEIHEFSGIFKTELDNFRGRNLFVRSFNIFSRVWDKRFILDSLEQMRDTAIKMHDSDWVRYESQVYQNTISKYMSSGRII